MKCPNRQYDQHIVGSIESCSVCNYYNGTEKTEAELRTALQQAEAERDEWVSRYAEHFTTEPEVTIRRLEMERDELQERIDREVERTILFFTEELQKLVDEQAEDEMLWFVTQNITEAYLQQELRRLHAAIENRPDVSPVPPTAEKGENEMLTVSAVCMCAKCESSGRDGRYRMVGHCTNCGQTDILMLFRSGDEAHNRDCPTCGSRGHGTFGGVRPDRLATPDEIPAAEPNPT